MINADSVCLDSHTTQSRCYTALTTRCNGRYNATKMGSGQSGVRLRDLLVDVTAGEAGHLKVGQRILSHAARLEDVPRHAVGIGAVDHRPADGKSRLGVGTDVGRAVLASRLEAHDGGTGRDADLLFYTLTPAGAVIPSPGFVRHAADGLAVVGINSNDIEAFPEDGPAGMAQEAASAGYTFPYLFDESQAVAKLFKAACTPDLYLFDGSRVVPADKRGSVNVDTVPTALVRSGSKIGLIGVPLLQVGSAAPLMICPWSSLAT